MQTVKEYSIQAAVSLRGKTVEEIEQVQLPLLKRHLYQAEKTPFYGQVFKDHNVDIEAVTTVSDLSFLPLTSRSDIDAFPEKFGLQDAVQYRDIALTSGTTGEAVIVPYTQNDLNRLAFNEAVAFYGAGVRPEDSVLLTVTLDRCFIAGLAYYSGVTHLGASAIRSGPGQPARQWQIIDKLKPRVIVGVPTFLREIGVWGEQNGLDVSGSSVETIVTIGEPARKPDCSPTQLGKDLQNIWGADLFSSYGATEFETAFCDCRQFSGGHVHPELMLVEIIDDKGRVLPDGSPGEVVVTPLGVEGFPLVRFRTGDIARLDSSPCKCGWNTKRLGPVEGRLAQRLKYKGTTLYPETIFNALQDTLDITAAFVEVRSTGEGNDDITVVVGVFDLSTDVKRIEEKLQAHLRVRPSIVLKKSDEVHAVMVGEGGRKPKKFFDLRTQ